ncbi:MAG: hypothetical protein IT428_31000 [Planctomycetaceae bacterium]|nr:hypothetical protein [Planctomycetaceae bacterium]
MKSSHTEERISLGLDLVQWEYLLLGELRELIADPPTELTRRALAMVLDALFDLLPARFDSEEHGGYLTDVTGRFPHWQDQVDALRVEHGLLYEELRDLRSSVEDPEMVRKHSARLLSATEDWMDRVRTHEREERRLQQIATNLTVGVGD